MAQFSQYLEHWWDVLVGEFLYQYRNNDDNDIVTRVSLETRLTKTDSSHVQEYVWLFAKQSINWQLCIGGVNSEIEITHSLLKWTKYLNAANVFQDTCSAALKFTHISDHILWYFYLDVFGGQFKLHTNEEVHPISPFLEIIFFRIISQVFFSHTQYYTHLFQEGMLPFREFTFSCWADDQFGNPAFRHIVPNISCEHSTTKIYFN